MALPPASTPWVGICPPGGMIDLVVNMEVHEHSASLRKFLRAFAVFLYAWCIVWTVVAAVVGFNAGLNPGKGGAGAAFYALIALHLTIL